MPACHTTTWHSVVWHSTSQHAMPCHAVLSSVVVCYAMQHAFREIKTDTSHEHAGTLTSAGTHPLHLPHSHVTAATGPPALKVPAIVLTMTPETLERAVTTWSVECQMGTYHLTTGTGTLGMGLMIIPDSNMEGLAMATMQMPIRLGGSWISCLSLPHMRPRYVVWHLIVPCYWHVGCTCRLVPRTHVSTSTKLQECYSCSTCFCWHSPLSVYSASGKTYQ